MRTASPPLSPADDDVTVYLVLDDFGPLGKAYVETDAAKALLSDIVDGLLHGQYRRPLRVVAFNTQEGWARDLTEDVAHETLDRAHEEQRELPPNTVDFIERNTDEFVPEALRA